MRLVRHRHPPEMVVLLVLGRHPVVLLGRVRVLGCQPVLLLGRVLPPVAEIHPNQLKMTLASRQ
jgi:hypothetical protein